MKRWGYMEKYFCLELAEGVVKGKKVTLEEIGMLLETAEDNIMLLFSGADMIRRHFLGDKVDVCSVINAKSGLCAEDCSYCAQSSMYDTKISPFPYIGRNKIFDVIEKIVNCGVRKAGIVTSGGKISKSIVSDICDAVREAKNKYGIKICVSLGMLDKDSLFLLKEAGVDSYHHNLETSKRFFPKICSTHTYQDKVDTVKNANNKGLKVCCGALFGLGEDMGDRVNLAFCIRKLEIKSIPLNFLDPIRGTCFENKKLISPMEALKTIAMFRYINPESHIKVCGGREVNLKDLQGMIFFAGASGLMTGNYLTTSGRGIDLDFQMLEDLNLKADWS